MLLGAAGISMTPLASAALVGGITAVTEKDIGKGLLAGIGGLASGALGEKLGNLFGMGADAGNADGNNKGALMRRLRLALLKRRQTRPQR